MAQKFTKIFNYIRANIFVFGIFVFIFTVILILVFGSVKYPEIINNNLAVIVALVALVISFLSVFKNEIFPFNLKILAGDMVIPASSGGVAAQYPIILPISFVNIGYGDGIIESIAVKVLNEDTGLENLFNPNAEIDLTKFIQGLRRLDAENILGIFSSFNLKSKETSKKSIMFLPAIDNEDYPFHNWEPGTHQFKLYVKLYDKDSLEVFSEFKWKFDQETFDKVDAGTSIFVYQTMKFNK